jgi:hypothetical protein
MTCELGWFFVPVNALGRGVSSCETCVPGKYQSNSIVITCTGTCPCAPSSGQSSGTFSDGPGYYDYNANCKWLIASTAEIRLSFSAFNTESGYDFVTINRCSSSSCNTTEQVAKLSGGSVSSNTVYTSSTGVHICWI